MTVRYENLPFDDAISFIAEKIDLPTKTWADITNEMHGRAFVVAGAQKQELVADFHKAILDTMTEGRDIAFFRKQFDEIVARHGWTYNGKRGWRTSIMLDTNLSTAYAAGRERQRRTPAVIKAFPNDTYRSMDDGRTRPLHQSWNGVTLPHVDPWWDTHTPPNGWNCRCWKEPSYGATAKSAPNDGEVAWKNPATGKTEYIPAGIDPGFAYNPADAAWGKEINTNLINKSESGKFTDINPLTWQDYKRPAKIPADTTKTGVTAELTGKNKGAAVRNLFNTIIGKHTYYKNPIGEIVYASEAIVDHILKKPETRLDGRERYFAFVREVIEDPFEIWVNFAKTEKGRVLARQKYIKGFQLSKNRSVTMLFDFVNNMWTGFDLFQGGISAKTKVRSGRLIYGRE